MTKDERLEALNKLVEKQIEDCKAPPGAWPKYVFRVDELGDVRRVVLAPGGQGWDDARDRERTFSESADEFPSEALLGTLVLLLA